MEDQYIQIEEEAIEEESDVTKSILESEDSLLDQPPKKRMRNERRESPYSDFVSKKMTRNPIETFFESMAQTVMMFPVALQTEAKIKVCEIVTQLENRLALAQEQEKSCLVCYGTS